MAGDRMPTIDALAALVEQRATEQPAARLSAAIDVGRELTELSDALIGRFVSEARGSGLSWTDIGQAFGTSKQAVQQRYGTPSYDLGRWPGRWTPAANETLSRAAAEARALGHHCVGTEHALLALVSAERGTAGDVLRDVGVTRDRVLSTGCMTPAADAPRPDTCLGAMPRFKQALEQSRRIADGLDVRLADTEHLLAGIVAVPDSLAVDILRRLGASATDVLAALAERLEVDPQQLRAPARRRRRLRVLAR
jgi:hypothetical protein